LLNNDDLRNTIIEKQKQRAMKYSPETLSKNLKQIAYS